MVDVRLPTTDGRHLTLSRYAHPEPDQLLLLAQLKLELPSRRPKSPPTRLQPSSSTMPL
jgi:hypothetical protein